MNDCCYRHCLYFLDVDRGLLSSILVSTLLSSSSSLSLELLDEKKPSLSLPPFAELYVFEGKASFCRLMDGGGAEEVADIEADNFPLC